MWGIRSASGRLEVLNNLGKLEILNQPDFRCKECYFPVDFMDNAVRQGFETVDEPRRDSLPSTSDVWSGYIIEKCWTQGFRSANDLVAELSKEVQSQAKSASALNTH